MDETSTRFTDPYWIEMVIRPEELGHHTSMGWEVVERFDHDEAILIQEPVPPDQRQNYSYQATYTRSQVGRVSSFRVRRRSDSPVDSLTSQIDQLRAKVRESEEKTGKVDKALETEKVKYAATQANLTRAQGDIEMLRLQRDQIEAIKRQLEGDLAKIREHIGRKMFNEILPPKPPLAATEASGK